MFKCSTFEFCLIVIFCCCVGWPVLLGSSWNERDSDWNNLITQLKGRLYEESSLYNVKLDITKTNSSKYTLSVRMEIQWTNIRLQFIVFKIDQAILGLPIEFLRKGWKSPLVKSYHQYLQEMAVLFGASQSRAIRGMRDVVDFEIKLSKVLSIKHKFKNKNDLFRFWKAKRSFGRILENNITWRSCLNWRRNFRW